MKNTLKSVVYFSFQVFFKNIITIIVLTITPTIQNIFSINSVKVLPGCTHSSAYLSQETDKCKVGQQLYLKLFLCKIF